MTGDYVGSLKTTTEIIPLLARKGDALGHFTAHWMRGWALWLLGRGGESLRGLRQALTLVEKNNNAFEIAMGELFLAELYCEAFDPQTAATLSERTLATLRTLQTQFGLQRALIMAGVAHLECGNLEQANAYLSESFDLYAASRIGFFWYFKMPLHCGLAELRLRQNNVPAAREEVERLRTFTDSNVNIGWRARTCEVSARIAIEEGDLTRAQAELGEALNLIRDRDVPLVAWRVHAAASALHRGTGEMPLANEHLDLSRAILSGFAGSFDDDEPLRHSVMRHVQSL
jgi:tetratricopeptide (TPR) repeat protein